MVTLFIADLHLQTSEPTIVALFLRFLREQARSAEALYILGDLFELWVGDDDQDQIGRQVSAALHELTETGVPVYLMRGNRDFLLGKRFSRDAGCTMLRDPHLIEINGTKILLCHGDSLCTDDRPHLRFRRFTHSRICQRIFLSLPQAWRRRIASRVRRTSQQHNATVPREILDVTGAAVDNVMQQYAVQYLVHGHTHRPNLHKTTMGMRIVLDAWHTRGNVFIWDSKSRGGSPPYRMEWFD